MKTTINKPSFGSQNCVRYVLLLLALVANFGLLVWHARAAGSYSFTRIETLGDAAPNGFFHINDFEPGAINNSGDIIYGTDLGSSVDPSSFFGEGVFLRRAGQAESELAHGTGPAPGGGVFDFLLL